jgi:tripartite-type tricarboxylate transporter receptor subunit TctC
MKKLFLVIAIFMTLGGAGRATAQTYPLRPITMVVPFPAGGPGDTIARILTERLRVSLSQPIIIENVPGANGSIGTGRVARAAPDGYTLVLGYWGTHVVNGAVYALQYDVLQDFEPVARLSSNPLLVAAKKGLPADDLKGLIAWLRTNPDTATQGIAGIGSAGHLAGLFLQKETGTRFHFVPYRGAAPAMQDLVAGQIDMNIAVPVNALPQVRAGTIKAYAITAKVRLATAPEIPTVDEAGLPGLQFSMWYGLWAPKGTPKDVIAKVNKAVVIALADATIRQKLGDQGMDIPPQEELTPEALRAYQKAEIEKWWPIIKTANIKPE